MTDIPTPSRIGRYEVEACIGRGGMGVVYRARDPQIGRTVAIKVMQAVDEASRRRFLQEMQFLGTLSHPNIVTIHDCGEYESRPYLVMAYVEGMTLTEYIRGVPAPASHRLRLVRELCAALDYAHARHIIHRDIKPANLMLDREGTLRVLDFGVARSSEAQLTQAGRVLGTLNYMSPEQLEGRVVDHRTDIFAVGLVMYELLSLRPAFPNDTAGRVINAVLHEEPLPLTTLRPDLDPELQRIVDTAIRKDPSRRYSSLKSLAADVARVEAKIESMAEPAEAPAAAGASTVTQPAGGLPHHLAGGHESALPGPVVPSSAETRRLARWGGASSSTSDNRYYLLGIAGTVLVGAILLSSQLMLRRPASEAPLPATPAEQTGIPELAPVTPRLEPLPSLAPLAGSTGAANQTVPASKGMGNTAAKDRPKELTIAAGQTFAIQLDTPISSDLNKVEDAVEAHVTQDVLVGGHIAIPAHSRVLGSVTVAEKAGGVNKPSRIGVRFHTIVVGSQMMVVDIDALVHDAPTGDSKKRIAIGAGPGATVGHFTGGTSTVKGGGADAAIANQSTEKGAEVAKGATAVIRLNGPLTVVIDK